MLKNSLMRWRRIFITICAIVLITLEVYFIGGAHLRSWMTDRRADKLFQQAQLLENKIVVGKTTRREFEVLFNATMSGGISNQDCNTNTYCHEYLIKIVVAFEDNASLSRCSPTAKIQQPITITKSHFTCT